MNTQRKQAGSALVVISIIIVVVILSGLGFVLWKNLSKTPTTQVSNKKETSQTTTVGLKEAHVDETFPAPLSWSYPETWTLTSTGSGPTSPDETTEQTFTMTSPSGEYSVTYRVGVNGGLGGTCSPEDVGTVQYVEKKPTDAFKKAQFVEYIGDSYTITNSVKELEGYYYKSVLLDNTASIQQTKVGSSVCDFGLSIISLSEKQGYTLLGASIEIKSFSTEDGYIKPVKDISTIKDAFNTPEYKDAVNILVSTKYNG